MAPIRERDDSFFVQTDVRHRDTLKVELDNPRGGAVWCASCEIIGSVAAPCLVELANINPNYSVAAAPLPDEGQINPHFQMRSDERGRQLRRPRCS